MDFDEFLREQLPSLVRFAGVLTADTHLAQDLTQDALVRAHARWSRIGRMDRPDLYLRRMITNGYLSWRRLASVRLSRPVAHADRLNRATSPDPAVQLADRDQVSLLLATLSRRQRAVLVLRFYEGRTDQEIATIFGCTTGTVRSHVSRALAGLRQRVRDAQTVDANLEVSES